MKGNENPVLFDKFDRERSAGSDSVHSYGKSEGRNMETILMIRELADVAAEQLAVYPVVTGKEKVKRWVKQGVLRQKLAPVDPFSWPCAMLGQGLLAAYELTGEKKYLLAVINHLNRWKKAGYPFFYVDNVMNGSLAMWIEALLSAGAKLEECGCTSAHQSGGKAASARHASGNLKGNPEDNLVLCRETESICASWLKKASCTGQGILPYRTQHPDWLFADTLGMVCPFLCRYGANNADERLLRLGASQLMQFLEKGMDSKTGLPYHGYDEKSGMKYGIIGWGRACGWMLKGMAESLPYIPKEWKEYEILAEAFGKLTDVVSGYQREDGGFSWQMEAQEGHRDSSAEGMIGTAIMRGRSAGLLSGDAYIRSVLRLSSTLQRSVSGGMVKDCSGECVGFAEYPQNYGSYPWGNGSGLEFFSLYAKIKVTDGEKEIG